jgi:hypothetical protein
MQTKQRRPKRSRNALDGKVFEVRRGLAVYKVNASPYFRARMWSAAQGKYLVKSTKEATKTAAIVAAEAMFEVLRSKGVIGSVPRSHTFETFAEKLIARQAARARAGRGHPQHAKNDEYILRLRGAGLIAYFGNRDVTTIRPGEINTYLQSLQTERGRELTPSTLNKYVNAFRKTLNIAVEDGTLANLPAITSVPRLDNPRPFFTFEPLVTNGNDLAKLHNAAVQLALEGARVRGGIITQELVDLIHFMVFSFVRPTVSELFAIRHRHVTVADDPLRLIIKIVKGKTGARESFTLPECVEVYERICRRFSERSPDDFIFLPNYSNRKTANRHMQNQFNLALVRAGLKVDPETGLKHSLYSLRHTAICMRIIRSDAQVNVFTLARNAGTSIDQIERFYAARLRPSREVARNLQLDMVKVAHEQERLERAHIETKRRQLQDALQRFQSQRLARSKQKGRGKTPGSSPDSDE